MYFKTKKDGIAKIPQEPVESFSNDIKILEEESFNNLTKGRAEITSNRQKLEKIIFKALNEANDQNKFNQILNKISFETFQTINTSKNDIEQEVQNLNKLMEKTQKCLENCIFVI